MDRSTVRDERCDKRVRDVIYYFVTWGWMLIWVSQCMWKGTDKLTGGFYRWGQVSGHQWARNFTITKWGWIWKRPRTHFRVSLRRHFVHPILYLSCVFNPNAVPSPQFAFFSLALAPSLRNIRAVVGVLRNQQFSVPTIRNGLSRGVRVTSSRILSIPCGKLWLFHRRLQALYRVWWATFF